MTMLNFIKSFFKDHDSSTAAKNRLKVVIAQDRKFPPQVMENLRKDLMNVFRNYFDIEEEGIEFNLGKDAKSTGLSISIPIKKVKGEHDYRSSSWN